jgi:hypothetical protein
MTPLMLVPLPAPHHPPRADGAAPQPAAAPAPSTPAPAPAPPQPQPANTGKGGISDAARDARKREAAVRALEAVLGLGPDEAEAAVSRDPGLASLSKRQLQVRAAPLK